MRHRLTIAALAAGLLLAPVLSSRPAFAAMTAEQVAKSKECSTQADAKGLHGKARKRFRSACRRGKA